MVLRVEKKLFVIEQPISPAPLADSKYLRSGMWFMMLIMRLLVLRSEEGKPIGPYVIKMKNYVAQLEHLGYVLPRDLSVGLIMNGHTSEFAGFIRNYNKHNMGNDWKGKGKDKSYIPETKNLKPSAKEHPAHDDTCHHCKEVGHCKRNCPTYLAELIKKKKQVGTASSSGTIKALRSDRGDEYISQDFKDYLKACGIVQQLTPSDMPGYEALVNRDTPNKLQKRSVKELEEIQDEDTSPSENTSEIPMEVEGFEPPQKEVIHVRRFVWIHRAPERLCLNVEVEEHSLGDLNEPTNYKAALLDPESDKWLDAMNAEMQSMKDN
ncbi:retrotransposon protein, putative, ty1-copia subclass [Tanacetum coccineum]